MSGTVRARFFCVFTGFGAFVCLMFSSYVSYAVCGNPAGNGGDIIYNADDTYLQYCDDTNWVSMHAPGTGSGGCTNPTATEGTLIHNGDDSTLQACAGNVWVAVLEAVSGGGTSDGLVAHWTFDEGSGTTAYDSSGNGLHASIVGNVNYATGARGGALNWPTVDKNEYLDVGAPAALNIATGTVTLWFKVNPATYSSGSRALFSKNASGTNDGDVLIRHKNDSGGQANLILFRISDGGSDTTVESNAPPSADTWYHAAFLFGTGGMKMYIDGVLQADTEALTRGMENASATLYMGNDAPGSTQELYGGTLDDVRVYNRTLSSEEITALVALGCTTPTAPPGAFIFNDDDKILQYCTDGTWRKID